MQRTGNTPHSLSGKGLFLSSRVLCCLLVCLVLAGAFAVASARAFTLPLQGKVEVSNSEGNNALVLHLVPEAGYYVYAHEGDSARPATVRLVTAEGAALQAVANYPKGVLRPDFFEKGKQVLAYEKPFSITVLPAAVPPEGALIRFSGLMCSAVNCVPVDADFAAKDGGGLSQTAPEDDELPALAPLSGLAPLSALPLPAMQTVAQPAAPLTFTPRYMQAALEPEGLFTALVLGLLAGLVLNVMPCVLPVLTIKISGLLHASGHETPARRRALFREHNLLFAAGILVWFVCLALLVGGLDLAWGGLFQSTGLVYGLLIGVFALALSMFDVFTLPMLDFKFGASGSPRLQAFFSGMTATLLATPCSGPLLGGVLAWAARQPVTVILLVFIATGLGMALPYLVLAAFPGTARLLPRPGSWTGVMERLVGFFLLGTSLYLLTILPSSLQVPALVALLVTALAVWLWGQWGGVLASPLKRVLVRGVACLMVGSAVWWSVQPAPVTVWQSYDPASFRAELGQRNLLVEFTADWCPSCKALERTVLTPAFLRDAAKAHNLTLIKIDLTRPHAEGDALLRALGSVSLPLTAVFPKGEEATSPLVLRDLYTQEQLQNALNALP